MPFILILIGLILIVFNYKAIKVENHSFEIQDRDNSFNKILDDNKNEMSDYKLELGLLRRNLGESLTDIQEEILEIKTRLHRIENSNYINVDKNDISKEDTVKVEDNVSNDVISEISILKNEDIETSIKTEKIKEFLQMGLTEEEICHTLSVSKGEVLLVKELFKK